MSISIHSRNNIYSNIFSKAYPQNSHAQKDLTEDEYSLRKQEYAQRLQALRQRVESDPAVVLATALENGETPTGKGAFKGHMPLAEVIERFGA